MSQQPAPASTYDAVPNRILMVTGAVARGGSERQMIALIDGLLALGFEVEIFEFIGVTPGQASFAGALDRMGVRVHRPGATVTPTRDMPVDWFGLRPFAALLPIDFAFAGAALAATIAAFRPQVIHGWSDFSNIAAGFIGVALGAPRVVLAQRTAPPPEWFSPSVAEVYRQAYGVLSRVPSVSMLNNCKASLAAFETWLAFPAGTIRLVYNGFLPSSVRIRPASERGECRELLALDADRPTVGVVMRLAREKDPDLWLAMATAIAAVRPDVQFVLAGYGHDDVIERLQAEANRLGLDGRLILPGAIDDVGLVYGALDVLALTSLTENVPNAMIEAQAAGVPVVGPNVGGIAEAMIDGVTGIVVRQRTAANLSAAVCHLLDDVEWRQRAEIDGPSFVAQRFGHERMVAETVAIYG